MSSCFLRNVMLCSRNAYRKWLRLLLNLFLQSFNMCAVDMSITYNMDKVSRTKICNRRKTRYEQRVPVPEKSPVELGRQT